MATGHTTGIGIGWSGESRGRQRASKRGPALAIGFSAIQPSPGQLPAFETFIWCEHDRAPGGLTLPAMAGFRRCPTGTGLRFGAPASAAILAGAGRRGARGRRRRRRHRHPEGVALHRRATQAGAG